MIKIDHSLIVKKLKIKKNNIINPSKDPGFLVRLHPICSPLEITTILTPNSHFLVFLCVFIHQYRSISKNYS